MRTVTCRRCRQAEVIPTYQFVKFDDQVNYLCQRCWEDFRRWFHHGAKWTEQACGHAA